MERLHVATAGSILFFVCLACRGSSSESTSSSASATTTATAPATTSAAATTTAIASASASAATDGPANAADITRFPDEKKLDEKATLEWGSSKIRKKPQGDQVAVLLKGTKVTKIAEHQGFFLITFADPKDGSRQLEGWVYKDSFTADECPPGKKMVESAATGRYCATICKTDAQCGSGFVCYSGTCISAQGE